MGQLWDYEVSNLRAFQTEEMEPGRALTAPQEPHDLEEPSEAAPHLGQSFPCILALVGGLFGEEAGEGGFGWFAVFRSSLGYVEWGDAGEMRMISLTGRKAKEGSYKTTTLPPPSPSLPQLVPLHLPMLHIIM
jgi:hypothetical protein